MSEHADTAILSVRVPVELRRRLKRISVERRTSVQQLVRDAVEDLVRDAEAPPPSLAEVQRILRAHEGEFRGRGVDRLYLFGSIVRGEAHSASDIDVAVDIAPGADVSLLDLIALKQRTEDLLGWPIDLGERTALEPYLRAELEREAIEVF